ncbi:MAG: hypothetical protein ACRDQX_04575, partial [Pseudonocardiaceae bacterium]
RRYEGNGEVTLRNSVRQIEHAVRGGGRGPVLTRLALFTLAIILVGAAGGLGGALVWPKTYAARAEIVCSLSQDQQGGDTLLQDPQLSTQLVILKSLAVLGPIARQQNRQYEDLAKDISAQILDSSDVIQVEADASTMPAALRTLQAVMTNYLALAAQPSAAANNLTTQLTQAHTTTVQLQTRVQQLATAVSATTQAALNAAQAQLTAAQNQENAIQQRIAEFGLTGQTGLYAQLLTPPYSVPDPVSPRPLLAAGIGALVGMLVAGAVLARGAPRWTNDLGWTNDLVRAPGKDHGKDKDADAGDAATPGALGGPAAGRVAQAPTDRPRSHD